MEKPLKELLEGSLSTTSTLNFSIKTKQLGLLFCYMHGTDEITLRTSVPIDVIEEGKYCDYEWRYTFCRNEDGWVIVSNGKTKMISDGEIFKLYGTVDVAWLNCVALNCISQAFKENPSVYAIQRQKELIWSLRDIKEAIEVSKKRFDEQKKEYESMQKLLKTGVMKECIVDVEVVRPG